MRTSPRTSARVAVGCLGLVASLLAPAHADEPVRWYFGMDHGIWTTAPSAGVAYDPQIDLEESARGGAVVVRVDLDGDGVKETFIRTACGNGGCDHRMFRGRGGAPLGAVFGSAVWILQRKANGLPVIRAYSHYQAERGSVVQYEFDGTAYRPTGTTEIGPDEQDTLFRALTRAATP